MEKSGLPERIHLMLGTSVGGVHAAPANDEEGQLGRSLDGLVKHFPEDQDEQRRGDRDKPGEEKPSVDDRLFERSWRAARKQGQPSGFSNQ